MPISWATATACLSSIRTRSVWSLAASVSASVSPCPLTNRSMTRRGPTAFSTACFTTPTASKSGAIRCAGIAGSSTGRCRGKDKGLKFRALVDLEDFEGRSPHTGDSMATWRKRWFYEMRPWVPFELVDFIAGWHVDHSDSLEILWPSVVDIEKIHD